MLITNTSSGQMFAGVNRSGEEEFYILESVYYGYQLIIITRIDSGHYTQYSKDFFDEMNALHYIHNRGGYVDVTA